jgi:predicted nucleic acid-binding protein
VKGYFDTNVLMAASVEGHPQHLQSFDLVRAVKDGVLKGCVSTQGLAEYYSAITRAPFVPRVHSAEAGRFLDDNVLPYFEVVGITAGEYKDVFRTCVNGGLVGGDVFSALHLHCAQKSGCDRFYTFDVKGFRALAPLTLVDKIAAP